MTDWRGPCGRRIHRWTVTHFSPCHRVMAVALPRLSWRNCRLMLQIAYRTLLSTPYLPRVRDSGSKASGNFYHELQQPVQQHEFQHDWRVPTFWWASEAVE